MERRLLNPALPISIGLDYVAFGQEPSSLVYVPGCPDDVFAQLDNLEHSKEILPELLVPPVLVRESVAKQMITDRRIAALSLISEDALAAQAILKESCVALGGLGGVGSGVARILASSGVGSLILYDDDVVDLTNTTKDTFYNASDVGKLKVDIVADFVRKHGAIVTANSSPMDSGVLETIDCDLVVWSGDNDEERSFDEIVQVGLRRGIACTRGGVTGWSVITGPTLLPGDFAFYSKPDLDSPTSRLFINPGTALSISLAASLISNEVLITLIGERRPPCHRRVFRLDLNNLQADFQSWPARR